MEIVILGTLKLTLEDNTMGDCLPFVPSSTHKRHHVGKNECHVHNNKVLNTTSVPLNLNKGEKIAIFEQWSTDVEVIPRIR